LKWRAVGKYTFKNYGIPYHTLLEKYSVEEFLYFEEEMYLDVDYSMASYKDNEPK
tara:strand:+ start:40688 stop:40852 length:165 start_codon:yes stop_codon:yes gene_type:complete